VFVNNSRNKDDQVIELSLNTRDSLDLTADMLHVEVCLILNSELPSFQSSSLRSFAPYPLPSPSAFLLMHLISFLASPPSPSPVWFLLSEQMEDQSTHKWKADGDRHRRLSSSFELDSARLDLENFLFSHGVKVFY
jgi:hypothetical protein